MRPVVALLCRDIFAELKVGDLETAVLQQRPERGAGEALAQGRHHAAGHEDELGALAARRIHAAASQCAHPCLLCSSEYKALTRSRSSGVSTAAELQGPTATSIACPW